MTIAEFAHLVFITDCTTGRMLLERPTRRNVSSASMRYSCSMAQTQLLLTINPGFKTIPYLPAERPDGSTCHGFKPLKGRAAAEAEAIPEAADTACIQRALIALNDTQTSVFTVGCEKAFNQDDEGFWAKGHIEFAFNYVDISRAAVPYLSRSFTSMSF